MQLIDAIDLATDLALAAGIRVMQTHYLQADLDEHIDTLLALMDLPVGARVLDAGCGIGEVARLLHLRRPDLQFTLVNLSQKQLDMAPDHFPRACASMAATGLPAHAFDVIMFHSALVQMPISPVLAECRRLLAPGGRLFLNELAPAVAVEAPELGAVFPTIAEWHRLLTRHGFAAGDWCALDADSTHFLDLLTPPRRADFAGAQAYCASYTCVGLAETAVPDALARHERIALQFSGGKDSLATLYRLRPYWERLTVYWTNTGDPVPEVQAVVEQVRALVPHFVEIAGRVVAQIAAHGLPSDLVPTTATPFGRLVAGGGEPLQDRLQCCAQSLMVPMHERMAADGITLIIRGQRMADTLKSPLRSGAVENGVEVLFPIEDWSDADVFAYLDAQGVTPAYYQALAASPDCLTCSAWWSEGRARWLQTHHPAASVIYQERLDTIRVLVSPHIAHFNHEVEV